MSSESINQSVLSGSVDKAESLFRVIKRSKPDYITKSGKISPALFKDNDGVSVDRDGGRPEKEIIRFIVDISFPGRAKAIVSFSAELCFSIGAKVIPKPTDTNPFHAIILMDSEERKRNLQALIMSDNCRIIYSNPNVEWLRLK